MRITFGSKKKIEVRAWGAEDSGKALLVTADGSLKDELLKAREAHPDWVELMTDPEVEVTMDDVEGAMMAVVNRKNVALFFDLDQLKIGVCTYQEEEEGEGE